MISNSEFPQISQEHYATEYRKILSVEQLFLPRKIYNQKRGYTELNKFHKYFTRIQIVSRVSHASRVFYFRKNLRLWCFTMFWIRLCLVFLLLTLTIYATASYSLLTCIFIIEKELLTGHNSHASFSKNIRSSSRVVLEL